jgi:hypothetical protein
MSLMGRTQSHPLLSRLPKQSEMGSGGLLNQGISCYAELNRLLSKQDKAPVSGTFLSVSD